MRESGCLGTTNSANLSPSHGDGPLLRVSEAAHRVLKCALPIAGDTHHPNDLVILDAQGHRSKGWQPAFIPHGEV